MMEAKRQKSHRVIVIREYGPKELVRKTSSAIDKLENDSEFQNTIIDIKLASSGLSSFSYHAVSLKAMIHYVREAKLNK